MSTMNEIFVGNISFDVVESQLLAYFSTFGKVVSCKLVMDRETQRPRGFGFIQYDDEQGANRAIAEANGQPFNGRDLNVNRSKPRANRSDDNRRGGGGGRGGWGGAR